MQHFALERLIMAINGHARAEYFRIYYRLHVAKTAFGDADKFQALRHTIVEHATEVEHIRYLITLQ
jgi:alkylation response protein AidB-like acyl-CoA dehydrogenase